MEAAAAATAVIAAAMNAEIPTEAAAQTLLQTRRAADAAVTAIYTGRVIWQVSTPTTAVTGQLKQEPRHRQRGVRLRHLPM